MGRKRLAQTHGPHRKDSKSLKYLGTMHHRVGVGCYTYSILIGKTTKNIYFIYQHQHHLLYKYITQKRYVVVEKWRFVKSIRQMQVKKLSKDAHCWTKV